jgi:adenine phosphoribosyltransferase
MIQPGERVAIVDDVLATGGTALATADLVTRLGGEVASFIFLLEITGLDGRARLSGTPAAALIQY